MYKRMEKEKIIKKENQTERAKTEVTSVKDGRQTICIRVFGIVQGVGFRPTVSRHAEKNHIRGSVCNMGPYVEIWAQGQKENLENFCRDIKERPPERAVILKMDVEEQEKAPVFDTFSIIESGKIQGDIFCVPGHCHL